VWICLHIWAVPVDIRAVPVDIYLYACIHIYAPCGCLHIWAVPVDIRVYVHVCLRSFVLTHQLEIFFVTKPCLLIHKFVCVYTYLHMRRAYIWIWAVSIFSRAYIYIWVVYVFTNVYTYLHTSEPCLYVHITSAHISVWHMSRAYIYIWVVYVFTNVFTYLQTSRAYMYILPARIFLYDTWAVPISTYEQCTYSNLSRLDYTNVYLSRACWYTWWQTRV